MKRFVCLFDAVVFVCAFIGAVVLGGGLGVYAAGWNPHAGLEQLFLTSWNHKDPAIVRYEIPQSINDTSRTVQYASSTTGNIDRPIASHIVPILADARNPQLPASWRMVEDYRLQHTPVQGSNQPVIIKDLNITNVPQHRVHHPAIFDANGVQTHSETYTLLFNFKGRDCIDIVPTLGQINSVRLGGKIRVWGNGYINLGKLAINDDGDLSLSRDLLLSDANVLTHGGKTYFKLKHRGTEYGIEMKKVADITGE